MLPSSSSNSSSMEGLALEARTPPDHDVEPIRAVENRNNSSSANSSSSSSSSSMVAKGKRTKRQRLHPSYALTGPAFSATMSSGETAGGATEEEEDMAKCLILLARGRALETAAVPKPEARGEEKFSSRRFAEATTTTAGKAGFYVYECRTCNKCFPSFQALGGHRASHKRPKTGAATEIVEDKKKEMIDREDSSNLRAVMATTTLGRPISTPAINGNKSRVHECSICGSEFLSGQALGGHMRRHRPVTTANTQGSSPEEAKKDNQKSLLSLDLNLPAPDDDDRSDFPKSPPAVTGAFPFSSKQQPLLFAPSALVDCHY